jgi:hypothetical protein
MPIWGVDVQASPEADFSLTYIWCITDEHPVEDNAAEVQDEHSEHSDDEPQHPGGLEQALHNIPGFGQGMAGMPGMPGFVQAGFGRLFTQVNIEIHF